MYSQLILLLIIYRYSNASTETESDSRRWQQCWRRDIPAQRKQTRRSVGVSRWGREVSLSVSCCGDKGEANIDTRVCVHHIAILNRIDLKESQVVLLHLLPYLQCISTFWTYETTTKKEEEKKTKTKRNNNSSNNNKSSTPILLGKAFTPHTSCSLASTALVMSMPSESCATVTFRLSLDTSTQKRVRLGKNMHKFENEQNE